jgi:hypothetical protein
MYYTRIVLPSLGTSAVTFPSAFHATQQQFQRTMTDTWRTFLAASGAVVANGEVAHFGNPQVEATAAADGESLADLSDLGAVHAAGEDARAFLHAQLTNDVSGLSNTRSAIAGYCNPKGRLLAVVRIVPWRDGFLLLIPRALLDVTIRRLRMFVLRARVTLTPCDALVAVGASGPAMPRHLPAAGMGAPDAVDACTHGPDVTVVRVPGTLPRFVLFGEPAALERSWRALRPHARPVGAGRWRWQDIVAGIPVIVSETVELFVPQMVNLDLVGGVNFKKGCYPGQEIVARMHYRAKAKQRMALMHADVDTAPDPGTPVFARSVGEQPAGHVVNAEAAPGGGIDALVSAQRSALELDVLRLGSSGGAALRARALPYPLAS